jgi:hypothetical protein
MRGAVGVVDVRFAVRLARRFTRSRALARSTSIVCLAALFLMAMFVTLATLSLSGEQVAERDLGRFGAAVGYGTISLRPGDETFSRDVAQRANGTGASDVMVMLTATDVQLPTTPSREVTLVQADWSARPFPDRYALLSGRWPRQPGEVVVTEPADVYATAGDTLAALGGQARFRVVGTADDRYARTTALLAAPGTWAALSPHVVDRFSLLRAQPVLLWSGNGSGRVVDAFTAAVTAAERPAAGGLRSAVAASLTTRRALTSRAERTWIDRTPAGYSIPSLLLPLAAVFLVFGLNDQRFRRTLTVLMSLGVRRATAVTGLSLAVLAWCSAAATTGALAGTGIGAAARVLIGHIRDKPSGPVDGLAVPLLRLVVVIGLGTVFGGVSLAWTRHTTGPLGARVVPLARLRTRGRDARHVLATAVLGGCAVFAVQVDAPPEAMVLTGLLTVGVLLGLPDIIEAVLRVLPEREPRWRLARRQLASDVRRLTAAVAVLTVLVSASSGYLTLLDTLVRTADRQAYPDVLPGQLLISDRGSTVLPPPRVVAEQMERSGIADGSARLQLRYALALDASGAATRTVTRQGSEANILTLDSIEQVAHLVGHRLTRDQQATLRAGGLLVWSGAAGIPRSPRGRTRLVLRAGDAITGRTPDLPVASVDVGLAGWRVGTDGILLTSRARALKLPIQSGSLMYTGFDPAAGRGRPAVRHRRRIGRQDRADLLRASARHPSRGAHRHSRGAGDAGSPRQPGRHAWSDADPAELSGSADQHRATDVLGTARPAVPARRHCRGQCRAGLVDRRHTRSRPRRPGVRLRPEHPVG